MVDQINSAKGHCEIALVGKYVELHDAYLSVEESLFHAASALGAKCKIRWVDSETVTPENVNEVLAGVDGVLIPGGFGLRGIEGMIQAAKYARENKVPLLGICLGMQIVTIEFARDVLGFADANSTEFDPKTAHPVIDLSEEQVDVTAKGATMRLGAYPCRIKKGTLAESLYKATEISERHRHRYEFNNKYQKDFEEAGLVLAGTYVKRQLVEIVELPSHPYYIACQYHPEFKSRPDIPHPLFLGLVGAALKRSK